MIPKVLDATLLSPDAIALRDKLLRKVMGQDRAVNQFVKIFQQIKTGMTRADRPAGVLLFMGPTGTGKTELVRAVAECLLGDKNAFTRIDCSEFQHSHETSKLFGSPPGYVGFDAHREGTARLSQKSIDKFQTPTNKLNLVLFDEIEEAHDSVFSAILQILDSRRLTLGNGEEVDFQNSIIIMTSNLGEKETRDALLGKGLGLKPESSATVTDDKIYRVSKAAAIKHFKTKFINRIDRIVVFRALEDITFRQILKKELRDVEFRLWQSKSRNWDRSTPFPQFQIIMRTTKAADDFLLKEGTSRLYGARELNRAIERFVAFPLGALSGSGQIEHGDVLEIDYVEGEKKLKFTKTEHRDMKPLPPLKYDGTPSEELMKLFLPEPKPEPPREPAK